MRENIFLSSYPVKKMAGIHSLKSDEVRLFTSSGRVVEVKWSSVAEDVAVFENDRIAVFGFGWFYAEPGRSREALLQEVFVTGTRRMADLNGEFLIVIVEKDSCCFSVVNDRFCSIQFHYFSSCDEFYGSFSFSDLMSFLKENGFPFSWNFSAAYEYLQFRRIHGSDTLCNEVSFLRAGHQIEWGDRLKVSRYFFPEYSVLGQNTRDIAKKIADSLSSSIRDKLSDVEECILFLSGGHDTRVILSALQKPASCYTLAFAPSSREILRARELAELVSAKHRTILLDPDLYQRTYEEAVQQNGGQYNVANIFLGVGNAVDSSAVGLCGTGLDYFFQGMYIPNQMKKIFGYSMYPETVPISEDVAAFYIENFSSRMKFSGLDGVIEPNMLPELKGNLYGKLISLHREAQNFGASKLQAYHHLFLSDPSRHYSYPDNLSMRTLCRLRTPCFDNRIHECFMKIDPAVCFDRKMTRAILDIFNPSFRKVLSANDDLPIVSRRMKLIHRIKRKFLRAPVQQAGGHFLEVERTWPTNDVALRNTANARAVLEELSDDGVAEQYLELEQFYKIYEKWLVRDGETPPHCADFLWNLAGLHAMISGVRRH